MIVVQNLSKSFGKKVVFKDINLTLKSGHIYGFIGANGCGKSIFFKVLSGFMKATKGMITYNDTILGKDVDVLPDLGVLIERPAFIEHYTHIENLLYLANIRKKITRSEIEKYLTLFDLEISNTDKVRHFSLGMRQKLAIIQAVMEDQKIIILDEPFNGLDRESKKITIDLLRRLKEEGKTVLLTSHIEGDMEMIADTLYEFSNYTLVNRQNVF